MVIQDPKVICGVDIALVGCLAKPIYRQLVVCRNHFPVSVGNPHVVLSGSQSLVCRPLVPNPRLLAVLPNAYSCVQSESEIILCLRIALLGSLSVPRHSSRVVLCNALAFAVHDAQPVLCSSIRS